MVTTRQVDPAITRSLAGAVPRSFWLGQPGAPEPVDALAGPVTADLAIIGGDFTGPVDRATRPRAVSRLQHRAP